MTDSLKKLKEWFRAGTAEGEKALLERCFVYVDEFSDAIAPPAGNPHLLVGPKGSGKSAILDFTLRISRQQNIPAILALLWQIVDFWDSHDGILVIHREPAFTGVGDGRGLAQRS